MDNTDGGTGEDGDDIGSIPTFFHVVLFLSALLPFCERALAFLQRGGLGGGLGSEGRRRSTSGRGQENFMSDEYAWPFISPWQVGVRAQLWAKGDPRGWSSPIDQKFKLGFI